MIEKWVQFFLKKVQKKFEKNLEGEEKRSIFAVPFGKEVTWRKEKLIERMKNKYNKYR